MISCSMKKINQKNTLENKLEQFTQLDLKSWDGLPSDMLNAYTEVLGSSPVPQDTTVGAFAAQLYQYELSATQKKLNVYQRNGVVFMIGLDTNIDQKILETLGEPCAILSQELYIEDAYAHEYLYCEKGLLITALQVFGQDQPTKVTRVRTFAPVKTAKEVKSELYYPLDAQEKF